MHPFKTQNVTAYSAALQNIPSESVSYQIESYRIKNYRIIYGYLRITTYHFIYLLNGKSRTHIST